MIEHDTEHPRNKPFIIYKEGKEKPVFSWYMVSWSGYDTYASSYKDIL
jgi:hypothetical protein